MSDTPLERKIYETAARDEDAFLIDHLKEVLAEMDWPPGWRRKYDRPGRPPAAPFPAPAGPSVQILSALHGALPLPPHHP